MGAQSMVTTIGDDSDAARMIENKISSSTIMIFEACIVKKKIYTFQYSLTLVGKFYHLALEIITGRRKMGANALIEYFKLLRKWFEGKNKETGAHIG